MALGSLSLNLALPDGFESDLASPVASLVPAATTLALTIDSLNDVKTRLAPRSRDETLDAGQLQLASGTAVVVDLRKLGEGKLQDTGALSQATSQGYCGGADPPASTCRRAEFASLGNGDHAAKGILRVPLLVVRARYGFELCSAERGQGNLAGKPRRLLC